MLNGDKTEHQAFMQMTEGFKMAASGCRQLSVLQRNSDFQGLAFMIDHLAQQASRLATSFAMKKHELEGGLNRFSEVMGGGIVGNG